MIPSAPLLPRSWKKRYPFSTGTTSFILPAGYTENVDCLGPYVDEIELLMFESQPGSRPTRRLAGDLAALAQKHTLTYNVHLPVDVDLTHPDLAMRRTACRIVQEFIAVLLPLAPTVFVVHLTPPAGIREGRELAAWQRLAAGSIDEVLQTGLAGRRLAVENLLFPHAWLMPIVEQLDLSVCMDTGHLALQGDDPAAFLTAWKSRIAIGHLHGLGSGRDHAALTGLPNEYQTVLAAWLAGFSGTVSLEVFALEPLRESLACLDRMMAAND